MGMKMHACFFVLAALWSSWHTSAVVADRGVPVFTVAGKPYFVYGAAFFYERTPRDEWRTDLERYRAAGINTIDLYLIWNWHEPDANTIDFDGHTNPRRDLRALFTLIHELGLHAIVRPGPVIRNEWRNGGYPDWLLERPEYGMPLHDVLEGRYPATATLQNAHADAAGAEWLSNKTHLTYASRWLHDVLTAIEPWSSDVIAIALDDDQGAYIDNDTWPAPHWRAYMSWLKATVHATVGPRVPLFINTYQMKVTASSPVWAWGNWYQSDAYRIGDHDLSQLAFSTGLLQTQHTVPVMASEFQAGWLQDADEARPRAAAPENTTLALHELLQLGAHGVVNFPLQDTLNPAGEEAPWANWFYAWDAALTLQGSASDRYRPTALLGDLIRHYGPMLATMQPKTDVEIAWLGSAYDPSIMTNDRFRALAEATVAAQQRCRALALTCRLVDLHYDTLRDLRRAHALVVPAALGPLAFEAITAAKLRALGTGTAIGPSVDAIRSHVHSSTGGVRDAALLIAPDGRHAIFDAFNSGTAARTIGPATLSFQTRRLTIPRMTIGPGAAIDLSFSGRGSTPVVLNPAATFDANAIPITASAFVPGDAAFRTVPRDGAIAYRFDAFRDGSATYVLDNGRVRLIVSADAGARAFVFEDLATHRNLFTTTGALRDDVAAPATPSPRDYIAAYTHPFPAGTFNRHYECAVAENGELASLKCRYTAPDLSAKPVRFEKQFVLAANSTSVSVRVEASAPARSISAIAPTESGKPYDRIDVPYGPGAPRWITFSTQGPPTVSANPGGSL